MTAARTRASSLRAAVQALAGPLPTDRDGIGAVLGGALQAALAAAGGSSGKLVLAREPLWDQVIPPSGAEHDHAVVRHTGRMARETLRPEGDAAYVLRTGEPVTVADTRELSAFGPFPAAVARRVGSFVLRPVRSEDRVSAALVADFRSTGEPSETVLTLLDVFAGTVAVWIERLRATHGERQLLQLQVEQLERSRNQLAAAEDRMRREVAELLHSHVQNRLLVAWHRLGQCETLLERDPARARAILAEVRQEIDDVREQEIRHVSHLLHPSIIDIGLVPAVRSLLNRFEHALRVSVQADPALEALDEPQGDAIPHELRLNLYRVLEEALNNVAKHAEASHVSVALQLASGEGEAGSGAERRHVAMAVADNGRGFDPETVEPGLGHSSIAGRIEQLSGTWRITSAPGEGTTVTVMVPLDRVSDDVGPGATPQPQRHPQQQPL